LIGGKVSINTELDENGSNLPALAREKLRKKRISDRSRMPFLWNTLPIFLILGAACAQIVDVDIFINTDEGSKKLSVDVVNENIQQKVLMFVNQYGVSSGAGCVEDKNCVVKKLVNILEHRAVEMLSSSSHTTFDVYGTEEGLFSNAGWHSVGNPHSTETPLDQVELRSKRRIEGNKIIKYIETFDHNATLALKLLRNKLEQQLLTSASSSAISLPNEYDCLEIDREFDQFRNEPKVPVHSSRSCSSPSSSSSSSQKGVVLALGIISAPSHLAHRMAIR
jgi:hypothetical protein